MLGKELLTREVSFRVTLQPLTGGRFEKPSPLKGKIAQVMRHWPAGCNSLVDLAVGHDGRIWFLPNEVDTFVALNDATPVVSCNEPIDSSEEIWIIVKNGDALNPHTITVTAVIEGIEVET